MKLASWNVRTLLDRNNNDERPRRRTALIAAELSRYDIDIAALSETRLSETGSLTEEGEQYTFFWSGRREGEPRMHGVGFAIKTKIMKSLSEMPKSVDERLITMRLPLAKGRFATLISAYAPTLTSDDQQKNFFYENLSDVLCRVPVSEELILLGDFNARVGTEAEAWRNVISHHGVGKMNENGLRLLSLCSEHELVITNTIFKMKNKFKTTWKHPRSGHWHLIDYVIVRQRSRASVAITRVMRGAECWTDHRLVLTKLTLSIRPPIRRGPITNRKLNVAQLKSDQVRTAYREAVAAQLASHNVDYLEGDDLEERWRNLCCCIRAAAEDTIGLQRKKHRDWFDEQRDDIQDLLKEKNRAHDDCLANPSSVAKRKRWQELRGHSQAKLRQLEDQWWQARAREIQRYADANEMNHFYDAVKQVTGPTDRSLTPVKSTEGVLLQNKEEILERWAQHFRELLNTRRPCNMDVLNELPVLPVEHAMELPPTERETLEALNSLKSNKSPGPDGIPSELLKCPELRDEIYAIILEIWERETVPSSWKNSNIVTIYKNKGEKSNCGNSRGISLLSHAGKVLTKIMLKRLVTHVSERLLPETQNGFRSERGTVDMMFAARQLQEKCREQNRDLYVAFVDLSKAFDTVNREMLWGMLGRYGCPEKFVSVLRQFHDGMESRVMLGGDESSPFPVRVGVKQGCVIAPVLFNLFVMGVTVLLQGDVGPDSAVCLSFRYDRSLFDIRKLQAKTKCNGSSFMELQYADDCALVAHSRPTLQNILTRVAEIYSKFGLCVNTEKTEILFQPRPTADQRDPTPFTIDGTELKFVNNFKYLGGFLSDNCSLDYEVNYRINQANRSYGRLRARVFENHNITLRTKVQVYVAVCLSALLYGSETWVLYRSQIQKLEAFHIRTLQRMMNISWRDMVPHVTILQRAHVTSVEAMLIQRQLRWTGHVIRMDDERLPKAILYGELAEGRRSRGGPKKRFKDQLKANMKKCNIPNGQLEALAHDRSHWRQTCRDGVVKFEQERSRLREERRDRRHRRVAEQQNNDEAWVCDECGRRCASRIGLHSHMRKHARQRLGERAVVIGHDGPP